MLKKIILIALCLLMIACSPKKDDETEEIYYYEQVPYTASEISQETIEWIENYNRLTREEQKTISYIPLDLQAKYEEYHTFTAQKLGILQEIPDYITIYLEFSDDPFIHLDDETEIKGFIDYFNHQELWLCADMEAYVSDEFFKRIENGEVKHFTVYGIKDQLNKVILDFYLFSDSDGFIHRDIRFDGEIYQIMGDEQIPIIEKERE